MDVGLTKLAEEIEAALVLEADLAERALAALANASSGIVVDVADLDSTDKVLAIIYAVRPGWSISIKGNATRPNGHWRCTLRKSSDRDNDEYLGIGRGPTLAHSLLAALMKALSYTH